MLLVIRLLQHQTNKFRRMRHRRSVTTRKSAPRGSPCSCRKWPFAPSCPSGPSSQAVSAAQTGSRTHARSRSHSSTPMVAHRRQNRCIDVRTIGRGVLSKCDITACRRLGRCIRFEAGQDLEVGRVARLDCKAARWKERADKVPLQEQNQRIDSSIDANYASEAVNMRK